MPWVLLMPTEALSPPSSEGCRWSCQAFSQGQNRNRSHLGAGGRRAGAGRRHLCRGRGPWALANPPLASGRGFLDLVTSPPPLVCHHGGFRTLSTYYVPGPEQSRPTVSYRPANRPRAPPGLQWGVGCELTTPAPEPASLTPGRPFCPCDPALQPLGGCGFAGRVGAVGAQGGGDLAGLTPQRDRASGQRAGAGRSSCPQQPWAQSPQLRPVSSR